MSSDPSYTIHKMLRILREIKIITVVEDSNILKEDLKKMATKYGKSS